MSHKLAPERAEGVRVTSVAEPTQSRALDVCLGAQYEERVRGPSVGGRRCDWRPHRAEESPASEADFYEWCGQRKDGFVFGKRCSTDHLVPRTPCDFLFRTTFPFQQAEGAIGRKKNISLETIRRHLAIVKRAAISDGQQQNK